MSDVIDLLAGIAPGSPLDAIRATPQAREHAQASYARCSRRRATSTPASWSALPSPVRRRAARPAGNCGVLRLGLAAAGARPLCRRDRRGRAAARDEGPYGHYPEGPLSAEDIAGPVYRAVADARRARREARGGVRAHAYAGVPSARCGAGGAAGAARCRLVDHRYRHVSQLVAFLAFQIRVVAGLRVLNARPRMTDKVLSHPAHLEPVEFTRDSSTGCHGWSRCRAGADRAALGRPGRCRALQVALFPAAGARPGYSRGPDTDRQGHLLQSRAPACRAPSASWRRRRRRATTAASTAPRCMPASPRPIPSGRGRRSPAGRGGGRRPGRTVERDRRGLGGADGDADRVRRRACRALRAVGLDEPRSST